MNTTDKTAVWQKVISAVCAVFLLSYLIYQGYMMVNKPVTTQTAYDYKVSDTVNTTIFAVRDEQYITSDATGTMISAAQDGSRVAAGQEVALLFASASAASDYTQLQNVMTQTARYEKLSTSTDNYAFDIDTLNDKIYNNVVNYIELADNSEYDSVPDAAESVRDSFITRALATGKTINVSSQLKALKAEQTALEAKDTTHTSVTAPYAGYYISSADGFENTIAYADVTSVTLSKAQALMKAKASSVPDGVVGKLVGNFTWYMICVVDADDIGDVNAGDTLTVKFPYSSVDSIKATVVSIPDTNSKKAVVVLSSNLMDSGISNLRRENAQLVTGSTEGYKISPDAVTVNSKGEKGVYVLEGNVVKFKKIDIVYSNSDFILTAAGKGSAYVRLYDNVITEGKDLYDGKVIS